MMGMMTHTTLEYHILLEYVEYTQILLASTYYVTYKDDEMMDWRMGRGTGRWADTGV